MTQKVIKIGTSAGVTIPKQALKELGLRTGERVEVSWNARKSELIIRRPARKDTAVSDEHIARLTYNFIQRYRRDLEALAKK